ncbi:hypothetical protein M9H77_36321 [Catharanthus roseus]|uniref:Uncharacterized protein n=1 Tax=Catharanthus roseus TaxID=4058 RepID=A0ACB9ZRG2_CATRO|nr:hypothetical protein M9H77_36321 [Catharanthus roseus]
MVRLGGRRGDHDLGPVLDKTGRVEGRTVTASSRGLRGQHSYSDIPSTPTPFATGMYYDTSAPGSSAQPPHILIRSRPPIPSHHPHTPGSYDTYGFSHPPSQPAPALYDPYVHAPSVRPNILYRSKVQEPMNEFSGPERKLGAEFWDQIVGAVHTDSSVHDDDDDDSDEDGDEEEHVPVAPVGTASSSGGRPRSRNKRPDKVRDVPAPTQRKKAKSSDWALTGPAEGGPINPDLIASYRDILPLERCMLKSRSRYIALTSWTLSDSEQELFDVTTDPQSGLSSSDWATCYIQYLLGSSLFIDKSGNVVPTKLWLLLKNARSCRGFA